MCSVLCSWGARAWLSQAKCIPLCLGSFKLLCLPLAVNAAVIVSNSSNSKQRIIAAAAVASVLV
jgi:hypothetical protein